MAHVAVRQAKDLKTPARKVMQSLLGRPLADDEKVTVMAFPPHPAPAEKTRRESAARHARVMDRAADKAKGASESDLEAAIDEAMAHVRGCRP